MKIACFLFCSAEPAKKLYFDRKENQSKLICVKKIENAPNKNEKFVAVISWKGETEKKPRTRHFPLSEKV